MPNGNCQLLNDSSAMISEEEARDTILRTISPLPVMQVALADALDLFVARSVTASIALPTFDNSAMDGYAVIAACARKGARLNVIAEQPAGISRSLRVAASEAVRIFTGAPMPMGADAVVMQEETTRDGNSIIIEAENVAAGEFVRKKGSDLAVDQQIVGVGERLCPARLGLLASQGSASIDVCRRSSVAIITTGDEIVAPGEQLRPGEIFESNGLMLAALAKRAGATVTMRSHARDEFADLCAALREGIKSDALIISGGVSVGERDLVREALKEMGVQVDLWRVKVKPGKPFLFGRHAGCAIFGLPGNPVSAFVTFMIFVRPALLRMMGANDAALRLHQVLARLDHDVVGDEIRPHYLRGRLVQGRFAAVGRQESHALFGLARANALLRVAPGENFAAGSEATVLLIN